MTLGVGIDELRAARVEQRAIVAAVAYDTVGIEAIAEAGRRTGQPVIAQIGASAFAHVDRAGLVAAALATASASSGAVGVHLDHSRDLDQIKRCLDDGYSSIMVDGSRLPLRENLALTAQAVELATPFGAWVEAELGHIAGDEDRSTDATVGLLTDPEQAAAFVAETGVDALAVCIGNVHGRTAQPVVLDVALLGELAEAVEQPLVLHGASGVPRPTMAEVVRTGVAKINVNADLRAAYLSAIAEAVGDPGSAESLGDDLPAVLAAAREAVTTQLVGLIEQHSA